MGRAQCQAIAKSTQKQCEKPALSGTVYCLLHYPKKQAMALFVLGILLTFAIQEAYDWLTVSSDERQIAELKEKVEELSIQNEELIDGKNELIAQNTGLSEKLDGYQRDLSEKDKRIKELEVQAKNARRGITENFSADGSRRRTDGGNIRVDVELKPIYEQMTSFSDQHRYSELASLCREQIESYPDWATPYLFLGTALANAGEIDEAINQLEYFLEIAPAASTYGYESYREQAGGFLGVLRKKREEGPSEGTPGPQNGPQ